MKSILYTKDEGIRGQLVSRLLFMGIDVCSINNFEKFDYILRTKDIHCVFFDIDYDLVESLQLIKKIRQADKELEKFITVIVSRKNTNILHNFILEGINTIFYKERVFSEYITKIIPKIYTTFKKKEKRRFERVTPVSMDDVGINIEIKGKSNYGFFRGKLLDISVAGLALKLEDELAMKHIKEEDTYINSVQVKIGNKIFYCDGVVTRKFDDRIAVKYIKTNSMFRKGISDFILDKMNV